MGQNCSSSELGFREPPFSLTYSADQKFSYLQKTLILTFVHWSKRDINIIIFSLKFGYSINQSLIKLENFQKKKNCQSIPLCNKSRLYTGLYTDFIVYTIDRLQYRVLSNLKIPKRNCQSIPLCNKSNRFNI